MINKIRSGLVGLALLAVGAANAQNSTNTLVGYQNTKLPEIKAEIPSTGDMTEKAKSPSIFHDIYVNEAFKSRYIGQRGFTSSKGEVLQQDVGFGIGRFNFDCWVNYDLQKNKVTEVDNTLATTFDFKDVKLGLQAIHFTFPSDKLGDMAEFGISIKSKRLPVDLGLYSGQIVGKESKYGQVHNFSVGKTFNLGNGVDLSLEGKVWYNNHYFAEGSGFSHASLRLAIDIDLGKGFTLSPYILGQKSIDDFGGVFKDRVVGGVGLTKTF